MPTCVDGEPSACVPGAPSTETCDDTDQDCDGVIDDGVPGAIDSTEPNDTCTSWGSLGTVVEGSAARDWWYTIHSAADTADYFRFDAEEGPHPDCFPFSDQDYRVQVTLTPPQGADCRDYDLRLYDDSCAQLVSSFATGCTVETTAYSWDGECGTDDSRYFRVAVLPYASAWECVPYTLSIEMWQI